MQQRLFLALFLIVGSVSNVWAFDLQGHRGARGLMPENTLPAFAKALAIGVTTLELDVGITKDGKVVVSHDSALSPAVARTSDGKWITERPLISELMLQELKEFDVGRADPASRVAKRFPNQTAVDGTKIPLLEDVFALVKHAGNESMRFNIETKINPLKPNDTVSPEVFVDTILALIDAHGLESRSSIQSFDWRTLQIVQKKNPRIETTYLTAQQDWLNNIASVGKEPSPWTAGFNLEKTGGDVPLLVKEAGGDTWSPFFGDLTEESVQVAHRLGLKVIPWTVNDPKVMAELIDLGVDGIISDFPDQLREVMASKGLELPQSSP